MSDLIPVLLIAACAHAAPAAAPSFAAGVAIAVAPQTVVNDPVLAERGAELRAALAKALAADGFKIDPAASLVALTSIDYTPWTAVTAGSLYVVVKLQRDGIGIDEVSVQRLNEGFPEPANLPALARELAYALATSPRLKP